MSPPVILNCHRQPPADLNPPTCGVVGRALVWLTEGVSDRALLVGFGFPVALLVGFNAGRALGWWG